MLMMLGLAYLLLCCWVKRGSPDAHDAGACLLPAVLLGETGNLDAHDAGACLPPAVVLGETGKP